MLLLNNPIILINGSKPNLHFRLQLIITVRGARSPQPMAEPSLPLPRLMETAARLAPFVLGTPPLAALHTMTEKAPSSLSYPTPTAAFHPITSSMKSLGFTSSGAATPFSINDILNRPDAVAQHHLLTNVSRFAAYNAGLYLHRLGKPLTDVAGILGTAAPFYWPAGLLPAPMWRDSSVHTTCKYK